MELTLDALTTLLATTVLGAAVLGRLGVTAGRPPLFAYGTGAAAGLLGPLLFMAPLGFCTFGPEATTADTALGYGLMLVGAALLLRLGWMWIDPEAARTRAEAADTTTHGVFKGHPFLPWLLLAPTLVILALFLYWPAGRTLTLSTQLVRLGAPGQVDRCVTNFTELVDPDRPGIAFAMLMVTAALFASAGWLRRTGEVRFERRAGLLSTVGVGALLFLLYLLWTASYQRVYVVTLIISAGTVIIGLALSIGIAYLAYQPIRGAGVYRTFLIWPYAISPPIAGLIFFVMFDPSNGIIEHWLASLFGLDLPNYRQNAALAQAVVILASVWKTLGYNLLFYIAGLQTVPNDQLEAAELDGANSWQRFRYVVIPALSPITFFLIVTNLTYAFFDTFGTIDYLTAGGPAGQTSVAMYEIYRIAIPGRDLGRGAAQSLILFIGVVALTMWQFRSTGRRVSYGA
ncbi:MAG: sugar ABC transporter permease [Nitriliruptor sp.]|nr:MAG: sugar ABC transporter permease [Nitriliruptor sp.]